MTKKELKEIIARKDLMISDIKQTAINYKLEKALELLKEVGELEVELTNESNGYLPDFLYSGIYNIKLKLKIN
jgi:hypothetical protein